MENCYRAHIHKIWLISCLSIPTLCSPLHHICLLLKSIFLRAFVLGMPCKKTRWKELSWHKWGKDESVFCDFLHMEFLGFSGFSGCTTQINPEVWIATVQQSCKDRLIVDFFHKVFLSKWKILVRTALYKMTPNHNRATYIIAIINFSVS